MIGSFNPRGIVAPHVWGGDAVARSSGLAVRWIVGCATIFAPLLACGAQLPAIRRDSGPAALIAVSARDSTPLPGSSRSDSLESAAARAAADSVRTLRVVISVNDRRLWTIIGDDTLLTAPVAVGRDAAFEYQGKQWMFSTRRGRRAVMRKDSLPVWAPPDWHYYEVARERGLLVRRLVPGQPVELMDGGRLEVRDTIIGVVERDARFTVLRAGDEIIFDGFLFMPPMRTRNRQIQGELGRYRLDLGDGFLLHGTPYQDSIGEAVTHGCIRLRDGDLQWLYELVPVGTPVFIY